ncbi:hypothetical protein [Miltoncostaea marina]|uniref:hypothetical protein n=1 Tax=Miltoncostaea marina TaxID=2843215 RepID=UPI001C3E0C05|nr:hypothetical protein [Miltoncostaea marina]
MRFIVRVALTAALAAGAAGGIGAGAAAAAGPPASAFVPAGFEVERRVSADIGGDRRADAVLVLRRVAPAGAPADEPPALARRLVLLKARADGGFVQIGEGRRVLLCTRCGGAFFGAATTPVRVRVRAKVVIVEQERGSRQLTRQRFRIRAEGALGTRLIGVDVRVADRLTGAVVERSTNLLTGERLVTRTDARGRRSVTRSRVPVRRIPLERVVQGAWR